jgi:hypothetical protein
MDPISFHFTKSSDAGGQFGMVRARSLAPLEKARGFDFITTAAPHELLASNHSSDASNA